MYQPLLFKSPQLLKRLSVSVSTTILWNLQPAVDTSPYWYLQGSPVARGRWCRRLQVGGSFVLIDRSRQPPGDLASCGVVWLVSKWGVLGADPAAAGGLLTVLAGASDAGLNYSVGTICGLCLHQCPGCRHASAGALVSRTNLRLVRCICRLTAVQNGLSVQVQVPVPADARHHTRSRGKRGAVELKHQFLPANAQTVCR